MDEITRGLEAVLLNGEKLGPVETWADLATWLENPQFFNAPKPVVVRPNQHLNTANGCACQGFIQVGTGVFKRTKTPFAIVLFTGTGGCPSIALVPQRHACLLQS